MNWTGKKTKKGIWTEGKLTKDFNKNDVIFEIDEHKYVKENLKKNENFFTDYKKILKLQKKKSEENQKSSPKKINSMPKKNKSLPSIPIKAYP